MFPPNCDKCAYTVCLSLSIMAKISLHHKKILTHFNPLSTNPTKWSNTLKNIVGCWR